MIALADIAPDFSFLASRGFAPAAASYVPNEFGNAMLIMSAPALSVRFARDRSQVFVDVGGEAVGWHKLEYILEFLDQSITQKTLGEPPNVSILAKLLDSHFDKVTYLFKSRTDMTRFLDFEKHKTANLVTKILANPIP